MVEENVQIDEKAERSTRIKKALISAFGILLGIIIGYIFILFIVSYIWENL